MAGVDAIYEKGIAVGHGMIHTDTIYFRHRDEVFEFVAYDVVPEYANYNGVHFEAKVTDLRKLKKKLYG